MLFIREVPPEVDFLERAAREVLVLDPYLISVVECLLIHLQVDQLHIVLYLDQGVFFLEQLLEDKEDLLILFEYLSFDEEPVCYPIFRPYHKHSLL